ncbi:MAG: hypothetical protein IJ927_05975 [Eubacterium sp.]|nr:hypothetical protein [Eubacterium sp.]
MTREEYIESIISQIDDKYARIEVKNELEAHLDDRIAFYTDAGYDIETSSNKALERMGDSKTVGLQMSNLYSNGKSNSIIWVLTIVYFILTVLYIVSFMLPEELFDFINIPAILFSSRIFVFSIAYLLSSKHKTHIPLGLLSAVNIIILLIYFSIFNIVIFGFDLFAISPILELIEGLTHFAFFRISEFYQEIIGVCKIVLLYITSATGMIYYANIKAQLNGKSRNNVIKKLKFFDYFAIILLLGELLPFAVLCVLLIK